MASGVAQTFSSLGNSVTDLGKKFKEVTNWDNMGRIGEAVATGGASLYVNAVDDANNAATNRVQTQNKANNELIYDRLDKADIKSKEDEAAKVMAAKKNSTAGTASGRQGTMAGGTLLGGGAASIGSKTLLGQ